MKKTLLIAAAALAAGVISSQAQVYSQNVVGYVNQTIPAGGFEIASSQLINGSDANETNGDVNTLFANGLVSSPNDPPNLSSNTQLYVWQPGGGYITYYYFNAADAVTWNGAGSLPGFYTAAGAYCPATLTSGQASFILNNSGSSLTLTTVGTVAQGTNVSTIGTGYNLISLQEPISTNVFGTSYGLPAGMTSSPVDPPTQSANDTLFVWKGSGYITYYYFNAADAVTWNGAGSLPGFYTAAGAYLPSTDYPKVNQGFFLYHNGSPISWTNSFSVQ